MSRRATPVTAQDVTIEDDIVVENSIDIDALETSVNTLTADIATNTLAIATNTSAITANTSAITTIQNTGSMQTAANTSAIATNTSDIATNTSAIAANTTAIAALSSPAFEYVKEENRYTIAVAGNGGVAMLNQMGVSITPSSTSKKILLIGHIMGECSASPQNMGLFIRRVVGTDRVTTDLKPTVSGNRSSIVADFNLNHRNENASTMETSSFIYVDEPNTTSPVTYSLFLLNSSESNTINFYFNRTVADRNTVIHERGVSTFTAEEKG